MADERLSLVEPIRSPWREQLIEALLQVQRDLLIVGPYIKDDVIAMLKDTLAKRLTPQPLVVRVITHVLPDDFLSGASDITALQHLLAWPTELAGGSVEMHAINNVHAKVWVFDTHLAIVGSGNATFSGLENNLEYGLAVSEPRLVERILSDWQRWWEQASPVNANELKQLSLWLEAIASDAEIRKAEKTAQEKRQAAERRIGAAPRIGNRLVVAQSAHKMKYAISERQNSYEASLPVSGQYAPEPPQATYHTLSAMVRVPASRLWHALRWTTSQTDSISQPFAANGTFLKITTRPISVEQQEVQFTWADGQRFSQTTIQGYTRDAQPSWTITLGRSAARQLVDYLQYVTGEIALDDQPLSASELLVWWQSSPSRFFVSQTRESSVPVAISCMPTAMSGNAPVLRPPLSQITIEQDLLLNGLMTLMQQWKRLHLDAPALDSIEISFGLPGVSSTLTLSVGPIEAPLFISIPGVDCLLSSPGIRQRLDFASFQHVVANAQGKVRGWRLCVGRDANAVQLIPEFDSEMAWAGPFKWIHELRDVAGG